MPRSDWRELSKIAGLALLLSGVSVFAWLENRPAPPRLPTYEYGQASNRDYYPGGSNCKPEVLTRLAGAKGLTERDRCAQAAEDHRLQSNDLAQQARAADAAQASAVYAFTQTRLMLLGAILGILTLVAAGFAAIYARLAFLTQDTSFKMLGRPFLYVNKFKASERWPGYWEIIAPIKNTGASPATNVRIKIGANIQPVPLCEPYYDKDVFLATIAPGTDPKAVVYIPISDEELAEIKASDKWVCVFTEVTFDSRFVKDKVITDERATFGPDFMKEFWIPQPGGPKDPEQPDIPDLIQDGKGEEA